MVVFEATSVTFINATSMVLSGLPSNTAYVQYPPRVNAGTFDTVCPSSRHPAVPVANHIPGSDRQSTVLHSMRASLESKHSLLRASSGAVLL